MRVVFVILVIAAGLTWFLLPSDHPPDNMESQAPISSERSGPDNGLRNPTEAGIGSLRGREAETRTIVRETPPGEDVESDSAVFGLILDADTMEPIPGARIDLTRPLHREFICLDLAPYRDFTPIASSASDAAGQFRLQAPTDVPIDMLVQSQGYGIVRRAFVFTGNETTVLMHPGAVFEGRIIHESTGEPLAGVGLTGWNKAEIHVLEGQTDINGNFRFEGLAEGPIVLTIDPPDHATPVWEIIQLTAGQTHRQDFTIKDGFAAFGVVTDRVTGLPIAGAEVGRGWSLRKTAVTDAQGQYRLLGLGGFGVNDMDARAKGYGKAQAALGVVKEATAHQDREVNFALDPANGAFGRVVDASGNPIPSVYCAAIASTFANGQQNTDHESCDSGEDGRFAFHSLNPKLSHQISLRAQGYGIRTYDFPPSESGVIDLGTFVLHEPGAIRGSVVNVAGQSLPGVSVILTGTNSDVSARRPKASKPHTTSYNSKRESITDPAGRFHFADVADGAYELQASFRESTLVSEKASMALAMGEISDNTTLVLDLGLSLAGKAMGPDNQPLGDVIIRAWPVSGKSSSASGTRTDTMGGFQIAGLDEGEYFVRIDMRYHKSSNSATRLASSAPLRISAGDSNLVLHGAGSAPLRIKLLNAQGQHQAKGYVRVLEANSEVVLDSGWSDDTGSLTIHVRPHEEFDILWIPSHLPFGSQEPADDSPNLRLNNAASGPEEHVLRQP